MNTRMLALAGCGLMALSVSGIAQAQTAASPTTASPATVPPAVETADGDLVVTGVRGALNEAISIERRSNTVVSVITADDAGQFADQNVAESLQRVAGVVIQRVEGEGRTVQVRGLNSNFNQVVINSAQIGSSDPDGNRSVSLDIISSDLLSGIRVAKTLLPDTDHDSLGAQVNLLTLSAFDREGTTGRFRAEAGLTEYADRISPKFGGDFTTLLDVGGEDTLGIAFAATYSRRYIQSEEVRGNTPLTRFVTPGTGAVTTTQLPGSERFFVPGIVDQRLKMNDRERIGGTFQIDFRPDDMNSYSLTLIGAQLTDGDTRIQNEWEVGQATVSVIAAGNGTATYNNVRLEQQQFFQRSRDRVFAANFLGSNQFDDWTLSYGGDFSHNRFTLPNALRGRFASGNNLRLGVAFDQDQADVTVLSGSLAPTGFAFNQVLIVDERRTDQIYSGFLNLQRDFEIGGMDAYLKIGGRYRDRTKVIRRGELSINPTSSTNRAATTAAGLPLNLSALPTSRPANTNFPGYFEHAQPDAVRDVVRRTATLFNLQATGTRLDFDFAEETWAGYVQGQIEFSPAVSLIGGVRFEQTTYTAAGLVVEQVELDGNDLPPLGAGAPQSFTRRSNEFFPSLHLRADVSDTVVARLSASRSQVRPTFDDARNFQQITTTQVTQNGAVRTIERELEGGNPRLEPLIANQLDATLAWYPTRATAFTAAVFYKDLQNPFISTTFFGADVALAGLPVLDPVTGTGFSEADTVGNGGSGRLIGVELGVNHQFTGALDGLFFNGNLTLIDGQARSQFVRNNAALRLEDQASIIGNVSAGYEDERFTGRVSASYVGDRLQSVDSTNPELDVLRGEFLTVDVNVRFNLTETVQVYADIANLTNMVDTRYYRGIAGVELPNRTSDFGRTFQIGAVVRF